ncbi:MAG: methyltransferase domain-containing protein [Arachnia sp.]
MRYILFPGRHHLVTRFQVERLRALVDAHPGAEVVWAITSADHGGTQRNPIPGPRRLGLIEGVAAAEQLPSLTFLIANRRPKPDFAHYVVEEIRTQTGGRVAMTPANTIVACSTPAVIADYTELGFALDPVELGTDEARPWDVVLAIIAAGPDWQDDAWIRERLHPEARAHFERYGLADAIQQIYADPLVDTDDGDITATRDYATYRAAFEDNAWRKVSEFADAVRPGRIVDVGCATGQTIKLLSERPELFESDFYGVEVARPLYEICQQRKTNGEFGDANVFFHQRNIMLTRLFEPNSLDTVITMALTHEIESYLGRDALLEFCARVYTMLRPGGVWINYDVVGPAGRDEPVLARFATSDGAATGELRELSSRARFDRFAHDFRHEEGDGISFETVDVAGEEHVRVTRGDLYEFLAKKDYIDSWHSEAHEKFCFFTPDEWVALLEDNGFVATDKTRPIRNPWLIDNRFSPAAQVFTETADGLVDDPWSWTNVLLVAEKPIG